MPVEKNEQRIFSLFEVTNSIQKTLQARYTSAFWVKAEMNKLNYYHRSGHCYPELVEKKDGKVIAQIRSNLWKNDYQRVNNKFQEVLKEPLKDGIKILFQAKITFDPVYGMSLWILDIDPSYTLGDLEREKQETIQKLSKEGIFNHNKLLQLPLLPQRIAVISVETSKGYADFLQVINTNPWKYKFFHFLFPALLQGDQAVQSILIQLNRIKKVLSHFDAVAIIRGGGGDVGLSCYNSYHLARKIALFPIPIITGIGHSTNETVVELVSYANAITPTKLAELLIQKLHNFSVPVQQAERTVIDQAKRILSDQYSKFNSEVKLFRSITHHALMRNHLNIKNLMSSISQHAHYTFISEKKQLESIQVDMRKKTNRLLTSNQQDLQGFVKTLSRNSFSEIHQHQLVLAQQKEKLQAYSQLKFKSSRLEIKNIEKNIANMSPENVLQRGYSITLLNGKAVKNIKKIKKDDTLTNQIFEGEIISIVQSTNKKTIDD